MNSMRFFSETGAGKHVPRCVMVDLDPGTERNVRVAGGRFGNTMDSCIFFVVCKKLRCGKKDIGKP